MTQNTSFEPASHTEEWFTLEDIKPVQTEKKLYCISVDSPTKQFLIGNIGVPTHNTDEGKAEDELRGEASMIIGSIARLGRAAGVHLIIATQRPDASLIPGETKANLGVRINCGRTDRNASFMILESGEGMRVKANPKGRLYLSIYGRGNHGQGFFADNKWMDEYLGKKGLNPDGTPITQPRSKLAGLTDFSSIEGSDLDGQNTHDHETSQQSPEHTQQSMQESMQEEQHVPTEPTEAEKAGLILDGGGGDKDKYHRPEEDWDMELEDLIRENNN